MLIIGCDFHPGFQQLSIFDNQSGEIRGLRLAHPQAAEQFYRALPAGEVLVGMEAEGHTQWFERLLGECGHQLWIGDAAQIRASVVRKQKTDAHDAEHLLQLLLEQRFPRIWVPSAEQRDLRQLLVHRHSRVRMRTQVKNQLQALALNQGVQRKRKLWNAAGRAELEGLPLLPHAAARRAALLRSLDQLEAEVAQLDQQVSAAARADVGAARLMTHPGVGPVTALATVLTVGPVQRFGRAKQLASYVGLVPSEHSSGGKQRLGHISKQGSTLLRFLLVEAAQVACRGDAEMKRAYVRLSLRRQRSIAKVAAARVLLQRMYWMMRWECDYPALMARMQASPGHSVAAKR
jgi:transposase